MKVVALVSGGKDSCYAMMKCIQYGHEVSLSFFCLFPEKKTTLYHPQNTTLYLFFGLCNAFSFFELLILIDCCIGKFDAC
jgi:diphthamide synthase (EF-2-diphthine--ammonia ligase)